MKRLYMKTIIQFYAFLIFLMCSTLALQSAEEKPARKKPTLSVVIPYSCLDEDGYLYLQDFTNSSKSFNHISEAVVFSREASSSCAFIRAFSASTIADAFTLSIRIRSRYS